MKIARPIRRKPGENIAPLINVVFLLLIFFMLTGTIVRPDFLRLTPPESETGTAPAGEPLRVLLDARGRLAVGRQVLDDGGLRRLVATRVKADPKLRVELAADGAVTAERVLDTLDALREAGVIRVSLSTTHRAGGGGSP